MDYSKEKFLKILRIEIEDIETDISLWENITQKKGEEGRITNYVLMENMALLRKEFGCIKTLLKDMDSFPVEDYPTLTEMAEALKKIFRERTHQYSFPGAVYNLVDRKIDKVAMYVANQ